VSSAPTAALAASYLAAKASNTLPSNIDPVWSADQSYIIFASNRTSVSDPTPTAYYHLFLLKLSGYSTSDSTTFVQLTGTSTTDAVSNQRWPTIGGGRVYYGDDNGTTGGTYSLTFQTLNVTSGSYSLSGRTTLFTGGTTVYNIQHPSASAGAVVFAARTSTANSHYHIYYYNAVSGQTLPTPITAAGTTVESDDENPAFAPNGNVFAFDSTATAFSTATVYTGAIPTALESKLNRNIWVMNISGTSFSYLTNSSTFNNITPTWTLATTNNLLNTMGNSYYIFFSSNRYTIKGDNHYHIYYLPATQTAAQSVEGGASSSLAIQVDTSDYQPSVADNTVGVTGYDNFSPTVSTLTSYIQVAYSTARYTYSLATDNPVQTDIAYNEAGGTDSYINNQPDNYVTALPASITTGGSTVSPPSDAAYLYSAGGIPSLLNREIATSQLIDINPPALVRFSTVPSQLFDIESFTNQGAYTKQLLPGNVVTIVTRVSDRQAGVRSVYLQLKDPDSRYQDSGSLEHKVHVRTLNSLSGDGPLMQRFLYGYVTGYTTSSADFVANSNLQTVTVSDAKALRGFYPGDTVCLIDLSTATEVSGKATSTITASYDGTVSDGTVSNPTPFSNGASSAYQGTIQSISGNVVTLTYRSGTGATLNQANTVLLDLNSGANEATYLSDSNEDFDPVHLGAGEATNNNNDGIALANAIEWTPVTPTGLTGGPGTYSATYPSKTGMNVLTTAKGDYQITSRDFFSPGDTIVIGEAGTVVNANTGAVKGQVTTYINKVIHTAATISQIAYYTLYINDPLTEAYRYNGDTSTTDNLVFADIVQVSHRSFDWEGPEIDCQALNAYYAPTSTDSNAPGDSDFATTVNFGTAGSDQWDSTDPTLYVTPKWLPGYTDDIGNYGRQAASSSFTSLSVSNVDTALSSGTVVLRVNIGSQTIANYFSVGSQVTLNLNDSSYTQGVVTAMSNTPNDQSITVKGVYSESTLLTTAGVPAHSITVFANRYVDTYVRKEWIQMYPLATYTTNVAADGISVSSAGIVNIPVNSISGFTVGDVIQLPLKDASSDEQVVQATITGINAVNTTTASGVFEGGVIIATIIAHAQNNGQLYTWAYAGGYTNLVPASNIREIASVGGGVLYRTTFTTPLTDSDFYFDVVFDDHAQSPLDSSQEGNWRIYDNVGGFTTHSFSKSTGLLLVADHVLPQKFAGELAGGQSSNDWFARLCGSESYLTDIDVDYNDATSYSTNRATLPSALVSSPPASLPQWGVALANNWSYGDGFTTSPYVSVLGEESTKLINGETSTFPGSNTYGGGYSNGLGVNSYVDGDMSTYSEYQNQPNFKYGSIAKTPGYYSYSDTALAPSGSSYNTHVNYTSSSQSYDIWRVLSRGGVTDSVLSSYAPTMTYQPSSSLTDVTKTNQVLSAPSCILWDVPFAGEDYVDSGSITDTDIQALLVNYVQNYGGRLYVGGKNVVNALTTSGTYSNTLVNNVLNAAFSAADTVIYTSSFTPVLTAVTGGYVSGDAFTSFNHEFYVHDTYTSPASTGQLYITTSGWEGAEKEPYYSDGSLNIASYFDLNSFTANKTTTGVTQLDVTAATGLQLIYTGTYASNTGLTSTTAGSGAITAFSSFGLESIGQAVGVYDGMFASYNLRSEIIHNLVCMLRTGYVKGFVTSSASGTSPVVGALVRAHCGSNYYTATTGADGSYTIYGCPPGGCSVDAYFANTALPGNVYTVPVVHGGDYTTMNLNTTQTILSAVTFVVTDTTGATLSGVKVALTSPTGAESDGYTNSNGQVTFNNVSGSTTPYTYVVGANEATYQPATGSVTFTNGEVMPTIDIVLQPAYVGFSMTVQNTLTNKTLNAAVQYYLMTSSVTTAPGSGTVVNDALTNSLIESIAGTNFSTITADSTAYNSLNAQYYTLNYLSTLLPAANPGVYYLYASVPGYSLTDQATGAAVSLTSGLKLNYAKDSGDPETVTLLATPTNMPVIVKVEEVVNGVATAIPNAVNKTASVNININGTEYPAVYDAADSTASFSAYYVASTPNSVSATYNASAVCDGYAAMAVNLSPTVVQSMYSGSATSANEIGPVVLSAANTANITVTVTYLNATDNPLSVTATAVDSATALSYTTTGSVAQTGATVQIAVPVQTVAKTYPVTITPAAGTGLNSGTGTCTVAANAQSQTASPFTINLGVAPVVITATLKDTSGNYLSASTPTLTLYTVSGSTYTAITSGVTQAGSAGVYTLTYTPAESVPGKEYAVSASVTNYISPAIMLVTPTSGLQSGVLGGLLIGGDTGSVSFSGSNAFISVLHSWTGNNVWQMITVPYNFADDANNSNNPPTIQELLNGWGGNTSISTSARVWAYVSGTGYVTDPTSPADTFRRGNGYWLMPGLDSSNTNALENGAVSLINYDSTKEAYNTSLPYTVALNKGWNIIGDPWDSGTASLSALGVSDGTQTYSWSQATSYVLNFVYPYLWTYDASNKTGDYPGYDVYSSTDSANYALKPFVGYWLYAYTDCYLVVYPPGT
jgi:hypothetical protein